MKPPERRWRAGEWGPTRAELGILMAVAFVAGLLLGAVAGWWFGVTP